MTNRLIVRFGSLLQQVAHRNTLRCAGRAALPLIVALVLSVSGWAQQTSGGQGAPVTGGITGTLVKGQRVAPSSTSALSASAPYYYTEQLTGGDLAARVNACNALLTAGGTCDSQGETTPTTTAVSITISNPGVLWIPPKGTITLGSGFQVNLTGPHDSVVCPYLWDTVFNAATNGSAGIFITSGNDDHVIGCMEIGGLLTEQTGVEMQISGADSSFEKNYLQYAGTFGMQITNCNNCLIANNRVDQSGKAAIYLNTSSGIGTGNKIINNEINDGNTFDSGDGQLGIASSGGVGFTRRTLVAGNVLKNLSTVASGTGTQSRTSCNGDITGATPLSVTLAGNGVTITGTTVGWVSAPNTVLFTAPVASQVVFSGIAGGGLANATPFTIASVTASTFTITNANCNASCTGTITLQIAGHGSAASGCSESIQVTDNPIDTNVTQNDVTNSWREGLVIAGTGNKLVNNQCESCGILGVGVGAFMWSNTTTPNATMGDGEISDNTCTNRTASLTVGYCVSINDAAASSAFTLENFVISNNQAYSDTTLAGPPAISKGLRFINNSANTVTLNNVTMTNNTMFRGVTTPISNTYTNTSGVWVMMNNRAITGQDAAPVSTHLVCFDALLNPTADCGLPVLIGGVGNGTGTITFGGNTSGTVGWGCNAAACNSLSTTATVNAGKYSNTPNCVTGASCTTATSGMAALTTAGTTVVVSTTSVTLSSEILLTFDATLGGASQLNVTCNTGTSTTATYWVSARTAGTSFTISTNVQPVTNPACLSWRLVN